MWSLDKLKECLKNVPSDAGRSKEDERGKNCIESAVLVPIILKNDLPYVLLTVRSSNLANYSGHVSLPGGKVDPTDSSLVATALREANEEIGLSQDNLIVLKSFPPFAASRSTTKILVTPVVAKVIDFESYHPKINPAEVCETFIVPLENFVRKEHHKCKNVVYKGNDIIIDYFEYSNEDFQGSYHIIGGFTAVVLTAVASVIFDCTPEFNYQEWLLYHSISNIHVETYNHFIHMMSRL